MQTRRPSPTAVLSKTSSKKRGGVALVEFALVFPIFILVTLGIVEFGRAMMVGQMITNCTREAARQAILDGATDAKVKKHIEDFLKDSVNVDKADITTKITITPAPGNPPSSSIETAQAKDLITIEVSVPYTKVSYITPEHLTSAKVGARASMRKE